MRSTASDSSSLADDRGLVRRAQEHRGTSEGDRAFREIVERVQTPLFSQIRMSVGDRDLALEILQETLLRGFEALPRFECRVRLRTWLGRIAHNLCVDEARRRKSRGPVHSLLVGATESGSGSVAELLADQAPSVEARLTRAEELERVREAVDQLHPTYREIIHLRIREEMPHTKIAELLGCSTGATKQRMYEAVRLLRKKLGKRA